MRKKHKPTERVNKKLFVLTFVLTLIGLIAVVDASAPQALNTFSDKLYYFKQQSMWAIVGVAAMMVAAKIHYSFWEKLALPIFAFSLLLLLLVFIPGLGVKVMGARRWLDIGFTTVQPSEIVKFALGLYLAKLAVRDKKLSAFLVPLGVVVLLIMLQPDLGTTLVVVFLAMTQIFVSGVSLIKFFYLIAGSGVTGLILILASDYRRERLLTFLKVSDDPLGRSYHIRQVLLGLGMGGFFGVGLGQSRQKYLFLPEAATDSIFAVVAEEVGFLGATFIIILFALFIFEALKIAMYAPDKFSQVLSIGIIGWIGGQTLLNLGAMLALVPLTGIPLPFFSYGGTALTTILFATGILLNISRYAKKNQSRS